MPKVDDFNLQYFASSVNSRGFVTTKEIPAGSKLVIGLGCGGPAAGVTATDSRGNTYTTRRSVVNAGNTYNVHLITCTVDTTIEIGDTVTLTLAGGANSQRWNVGFAWFDDVDSIVPTVTAGQEQNSAAASSGDMAAANDLNLVIGACCHTNAAFPATATDGATLICSIVTSAGSAERGFAFSYEYDTEASRAATFGLSAASTVVTAGLVLDATDAVPPSDIGNTATDDVMDSLIDAGYVTGSLRDRQMAQHIAAGRNTGSYADRSKVAGTPIFPRAMDN